MRCERSPAAIFAAVCSTRASGSKVRVTITQVIAIAAASVASPNAKVSTPTSATTWFVCFSGRAITIEDAWPLVEDSKEIGIIRQSLEPVREFTVVPVSWYFLTFSESQPVRTGSFSAC